MRPNHSIEPPARAAVIFGFCHDFVSLPGTDALSFAAARRFLVRRQTGETKNSGKELTIGRLGSFDRFLPPWQVATRIEDPQRQNRLQHLHKKRLSPI